MSGARMVAPEAHGGGFAMVADGELISYAERAAFVRRELIDRLWQSIEVAAPPPAPAAPVGAIDWIIGDAEVRGLLKLALDACRDDVLVLRPDPAASPELIDILAGHPASGHPPSGRPVAIRVLCPHRSRADFADRAHTLLMVDRGVQVRTVTQLPQSAVIVDREIAILLGVDEEGRPTAQRVRDRSLVLCLVGLFDQLWYGGVPFVAGQTGYQPVADDLQVTIARLMAEGLTDEVVARRLGMSVRTCRRHIAALLRNLDSISRFQAGVQAAGWLRTSAPQPA
jgi:DNA-binding CsgD family transcriptional regulator